MLLFVDGVTSTAHLPRALTELVTAPDGVSFGIVAVTTAWTSTPWFLAQGVVVPPAAPQLPLSVAVLVGTLATTVEGTSASSTTRSTPTDSTGTWRDEGTEMDGSSHGDETETRLRIQHMRAATARVAVGVRTRTSGVVDRGDATDAHRVAVSSR